MSQDPRPAEMVNCITCGAKPGEPCVVQGTKRPALTIHSQRARKWKLYQRRHEVSMPSRLTYDFPLRPDMIVRLTLPLDLTPQEAERVNGFIRAAAFSDDALAGAAP